MGGFSALLRIALVPIMTIIIFADVVSGTWLEDEGKRQFYELVASNPHRFVISV